MGKTIWTIDDLSIDGKRVILRVDINSPIRPDTGEILDDTRFRAHASTIIELSDKKARLILIAHQGRPFTEDFHRLERHREVLEKILGREVKYVPDVIGPRAKDAIKDLKPGDILLLDNTRLLSEDAMEAPLEAQKNSIFARELSSAADFYVNDAFAAAHRSQASTVGIALNLPSAAGRLLEKEVNILSRAVSPDERPKVYVLGGAKLKDSIKIIENLVSMGTADEILTTGLVGLLFLMVSGVDVGPVKNVILKKTDEKTRDLARKLLASTPKIRVPLDFVTETEEGLEIVEATRIIGTPKDIGPSTIEYYTYKMRSAKIIVMRGPAGVIEDPRFRRGTRELVEYSLRSTNAFTIFGGGHFNAILSQLPESLKKRIGHVSTGGGALLYFLSGRTLPALEALAISYEKFNESLR